jgi:putative transposase
LKYEVGIIGFCLRTNHIHIIAVPQGQTSLAKALGRTHSDYARWLHIRRRESGHLWQNRFFSCPLQPAHAWAALAYVERNPIGARLVAKAEQWQWSSARAHLGQCQRPDWLAMRPWADNWTHEQWRTVLEHGLSEVNLRERLQKATQTGKPLGNTEFINHCEQQSGMRLRKQKPGPKRKQASLDSEPAALYGGGLTAIRESW